MSLEVDRARLEGTQKVQAHIQGQIVEKAEENDHTTSAIAKWEEAAREASSRWEDRQQELLALASQLVRCERPRASASASAGAGADS